MMTHQTLAVGLTYNIIHSRVTTPFDPRPAEFEVIEQVRNDAHNTITSELRII